MAESPPLVVVTGERHDSVSSTESGQGEFDTQNQGPQYRCSSCDAAQHHVLIRVHPYQIMHGYHGRGSVPIETEKKGVSAGFLK